MERAPPRIFDRNAVAAKFGRAEDRRATGGATYLAAMMAEDVAERLDFMQFAPKDALVVGDTAHVLPASTRADLGRLDEERPVASGPHDLYIHLLGLGMVNDLPGALIHARAALTQGGLFIAAFPGAGSLPALRRIALAADDDRPAARVHPQVDNRAGTALLERAGFARQVVDSYPLKVRFSSLDQLVSDLRDHGLTGSLANMPPPFTRTGLQRARAEFDAMREEDGKVTETFDILVLTGWR